MWKCEMKDHVIVASVYDNDDNDDDAYMIPIVLNSIC